MEKNEIKTRNNSIDIFRYICSIMVVTIHTGLFSDINENLSYIFTQIIPRIGVPFFFAISGYFYIQKLEKGQNPFSHYIKRLIFVYSIWTFLYYAIDFILWGHSNLKNFFISSIYKFFVTGSCEPFWFFPALIFSVCIITLLFKIRCNKLSIPLSIVLYIIGCLGCSYYKIGISIPILKNLVLSSQFTLIRRILLMGFPFFVSGYLVYKIKQKFCNISIKKLFALEIISIILWLLEIFIVRRLEWEVNIVITFGLYLLVIVTLLILLTNPLQKFSAFSNRCRVLANFTYYSHPLFITCFYELRNRIYISETPKFFLTVAFTFVLGTIIYKLNNRFLNIFVK